MICKECGNQVSDNAIFCTSCGIKLENSSEELAVRTDFVSMVNAAKTWIKNARTALILGIVSLSIVPGVALTWICIPAINVLSFLFTWIPVLGTILTVLLTSFSVISTPIMLLLLVCSAIAAPVCAFIARSLIKKANNQPEVTSEVMNYTDDEDLYKDYLSAQKKASIAKTLTTIVLILFWIAIALLIIALLLIVVLVVLAVTGIVGFTGLGSALSMIDIPDLIVDFGLEDVVNTILEFFFY